MSVAPPRDASGGRPAAPSDPTAVASAVEGEGPLTIDRLAARTGVPSRTIRFYQTAGALPAPGRRGRIAVYTEDHVERLELIDVLQRRGLRLSAIADLVRNGGGEGLRVSEWLGLEGRLAAPWSEDHPVVVTRAARDGERLLVRSPALVDVVVKLEAAGIAVETTLGAGAIIAARLGPAAEELVRYFAGHAGRGFGPVPTPAALDHVMAVLRPLGLEAVRLIFAREVERALRRLLTDASPGRPVPVRDAAVREGGSGQRRRPAGGELR